ncbi:MAG: metallophosphoesterase [Chloroflexota bacterium]|nr:metallophosphoesterase [Chloroflexota bacterium]
MSIRKFPLTCWLLILLVVFTVSGCSQETLQGLPQQLATPVRGSINEPSPGAASPTAALEVPSETPERQATRPVPTNTPQLPPTPEESAGEAEAVLVGAGDIGDCDGNGDERTAELLDDIEGTVFTLGDNVYERGTAKEFRECYDDSWGRHKGRTRPAAGNHDYRTEDAKPYYDYFGEAAGEEGKGYYSYDLGSWHIVVLNSNCKYVGGCEEGSEQVRWLVDDLQEHPAQCTLAYWHHPLFNVGEHGNDEAVRRFWDALYGAGADVVLTGHDHNYQRYAPQDPSGDNDPEQGIRQFVVGTGGKSHYKIEKDLPNLEVSNDDTDGVLKLTLKPDGYDWEFIPVEGQDFRDAGTGTCH